MSAFRKYNKTDKEANKEVQDIITTYDDEARQARQAHQARLRAEADDAARIVREYHQREKNKEGFCVTMGGRIKTKSKRCNKRVKKNKRHSRNSRKYSRKSLKK